jgi:DNA-3-methyladenine glycosylase I
LDEKVGVLTQAQNLQTPSWYYRKTRPLNDNAYFENLCRIVISSGLKWDIIDRKWSIIRKALEDFSVEKIAHFTNADIDKLIEIYDVIHNKGKIQTIVQHAQQFRKLKKTYGSFQKFLDCHDKSNNYAHLINQLSHMFRWLSPPAARLFLYSVGEEVENL